MIFRATILGFTVLGLVFGVSPPKQCPPRSFMFRNTCYWMPREVVPFQNAERLCAQEGGILASPSDYDSYTFLKDVAFKMRMGSYWVGLADSDGQWRFSDGTWLGDHGRWNWLWKEGEPAGAPNELCGLMASGSDHRVISTACTWSFYSLCQLTRGGHGTETTTNEVQTTTAYTTSTTVAATAPTGGYIKPAGGYIQPTVGYVQPTVGYIQPTGYPQTTDQRIPDGSLWRPFARPPPSIIPSVTSLSCSTRELRTFQIVIPTDQPSLPAGTILQVRCVEGFYIQLGEGSITCNSSGQWDMKDQLCAAGCHKPNIQPPLQVYNDKPGYNVGEKLLFVCENDAIPFGNPVICLASGKWSEQIPDCRSKSDSLCPFPFPIRQSSVHEVERGTRVNLQCFTKDSENSSIPPQLQQRFNVIWMRDQNILNVGVKPDGSLELGPAGPHQEGLYTCIASGGRGRSMHTNSMQVVYSTDCNVGLDVEPQDAVVEEGGYTILSCSLHNAVISWYKDEMLLQGDQRHEVLPNSALLIHDATIADAGQYTCVAEERTKRCRVSHTVKVSVEVSGDEICGQPRVPVNRGEARGKVVGGQESVKGSHPWLVMINKVVGGREVYLCGGNIINNYWILTAAHCFAWLVSKREVEQLKVEVGKYNRTQQEGDQQSYTVVELIIHPQFDPDTFDNDLALMRLSGKIFFSNSALPICLPKPDFLNHFYPIKEDFSSGIVAGWGRIQEDGRQPTVVRHVRLPLVLPERCDNSTDMPTTPNMFCAGYEDAIGDTCQGDSGGPFEMIKDGKTFLAGIVSWGEGCGREGKFGFYTVIGHYVEFIEKTTSSTTSSATIY